MNDIFTLSATDLGALLCSRVCHDIISPVGAINNGLELLDEGGADEDAMQLIRASAVNASARLQFARIAFGAAGSAGMQIDTGDAEAVATAFIRNEKPELEWIGTRALLPKNKVKLLLNLLLVANEKLSYQEIGELTNQTADAVRGKLHRARKAFAAAFPKTATTQL